MIVVDLIAAWQIWKWFCMGALWFYDRLEDR